MTVRKAVIPAAGFGTRFLPVTKTVPKEMLPIMARPVIQYVVEAAVDSGVDNIILVTGSNKKALEDYFDANFELEWTLERDGKDHLLHAVRRTTNLANISYVRQTKPLGNGHAVLVARRLVGDEPFVVLWGDDVLIAEPPVPRQLIDIYERYGGPVVGVRRVPKADVEKYGVLEVDPLGDGVYRALSVVEKPKRDEAPSDLAQIGGFVLTPDVFDILASLPTGGTGELYLADALNELMAQRPVYAYEFTGRRYDAGNKLDYIRANVELALEDPDIGPDFRRYLESLATEAAAPR